MRELACHLISVAMFLHPLLTVRTQLVYHPASIRHVCVSNVMLAYDHRVPIKADDVAQTPTRLNRQTWSRLLSYVVRQIASPPARTITCSVHSNTLETDL